jgi:hypothetical protein
VRKQKRLRNLHPAGKWKRILSACNYWWSNVNLRDDAFLKNELRKQGGWCRISELLKFPKLKIWTDAELVIDSLTSTAAHKWEVDVNEAFPMKSKVRRVDVTLDYIDEIEREMDVDENDDNKSTTASGLDLESNPLSEHEIKKSPPTQKERNLPFFNSKRKVIVARSPNDIAPLCMKLTKSIKQSGPNSFPLVLGMDVEYATLELDIRGDLPAMLQLASPDPTGPVGLFWLDKLPNHGKSILHDGEAYKPLLSILASSDIEKVGVGLTSDVRHLLDWWGVSDAATYSPYFIANTVDISEVYSSDTRVADRSLQEMCESVLQLHLRKRKSISRNKKRSHWRAEVLTKQMKEYAANDAACAVEVYLSLCAEESDDSDDSGDDDENDHSSIDHSDADERDPSS